jgi:hypothetical protein
VNKIKNNFHIAFYSSASSLLSGGGGGYTICGLSLFGELK